MFYWRKLMLLIRNYVNKNISEEKLSAIEQYFLDQLNFIKPENWENSSINFKIHYIQKYTDYKIIDNEYIYAYKLVDYNYKAYFYHNMIYYPGDTYEVLRCDCNALTDSSYGLNAWTLEKINKYYITAGYRGIVLKLRININDIGVITPTQKIRCFKFFVYKQI